MVGGRSLSTAVMSHSLFIQFICLLYAPRSTTVQFRAMVTIEHYCWKLHTLVSLAVRPPVAGASSEVFARRLQH